MSVFKNPHGLWGGKSSGPQVAHRWSETFTWHPIDSNNYTASYMWVMAGDVWKTHVHLDVNFPVLFPVLIKTETNQQILSKLHIRFHVYNLMLILLHAKRGKAREVERVNLIGSSVTFCHSCQQLNTQKVH